MASKMVRLVNGLVTISCLLAPLATTNAEDYRIYFCPDGKLDPATNTDIRYQGTSPIKTVFFRRFRIAKTRGIFIEFTGAQTAITWGSTLLERHATKGTAKYLQWPITAAVYLLR